MIALLGSFRVINVGLSDLILVLVNLLAKSSGAVFSRRGGKQGKAEVRGGLRAERRVDKFNW